ncbi:hypothetical protein P692DRAFT_20821413 [Suillus brevipes Sb2]|nr:hypothetical protein P692DRAFT_20821413 [Suillus brevipes Sb2]
MDKEHRRLGEQYHNLATASARKNFMKEFATRSPMHNLFLGLVKTHFYNIWVQSKILHPNHELQTFHDMLADIPQLWSKCLPTDVDDQFLHQRAAMVQRAEADKEAGAAEKAQDRKALADAKKISKDAWEAEKTRIANKKVVAGDTKVQEKLRLASLKQVEKPRLAAEKKAKAAERKASKRKATSQTVEDLLEGQVQPPPPPPTALGPEASRFEDTETDTKFSLHPDDPRNFLKLCTALRIIIKHHITDEDLDRVDLLIRDYVTELISLYGSAVIKPNHHYATHIAECARNFGPLHDFWTFLFERLNKVLKSFKTNNHGNGELETTFFHEFQRTCQIGRLTFSLCRYPEETLPFEVSKIMLKASNDERGTIAGIAAFTKELDDDLADATQTYAPSPRRHKKDMPTETY